ncbi:D-alanyl-D-alanine carboxypeptidase [Clostridium sardiniense]|uniref:D-alanyl-D-alanine carboxypeptidase n=1 Tax=Clostridium sardiniense TaxID=29369 RepID=A0ABS7L2U5_CLOSR|nr:D-alanyl-D-alanine carboxypeptidase [Clostridium sardiniense]MDQ0461971.1 D-alanyl-D-alanine carboxypeptidase [Clostridium sardiniense]
MEKLKKYMSFIFILCLIFNMISIQAFASNNDKLKVSARNAIAIEKESGQILFEQNAYEVVPMASTTKILTALVAIKNSDLDKVFEVSKNAAAVRGSKVGYKAEEKITLRELLYGLMYRSGNDAAITIAEGIGGSVEGFSDIMNHFAKSIGIIDSHFQTPHGLDKEEHYSSAYDLAILTSKAMEYDVFREIVGTKEIKKEKYNFTRDYNNINKILWKIPGANGVKTGYTGGAGKCLVSSVNCDSKDIIIVVLNCPDRWNQTEKIFNYIKDRYAFNSDTTKQLVLGEGNPVLGSLVKDERVINAFTQDGTQYEIDVFKPYLDIKEGEIIGAFKVQENNIKKMEHPLTSYKEITSVDFINILGIQ